MEFITINYNNLTLGIRLNKLSNTIHPAKENIIVSK